MTEEWEQCLRRWTQASLIHPDQASQIRAYESSRASEYRLRWPILVAISLGALASTAGVLLFVSAHWDDLSASERFVLVLLMLLAVHLGGAFASERFHIFSITLHTIGTTILGAAIALIGQIFNLNEHWPAGILLWTIGAVLGWLILSHWTQAVIAAVLAPTWLALEWCFAVTEGQASSTAPAFVFLFLIAVIYLTGKQSESDSNFRKALVWIGALSILPLGIGLSFARPQPYLLTGPAILLAWFLAFAIPLALAFVLRVSWPWLLGALVWTAAIIHLVHGGIAGYAWDALGAVGLAMWGMKEGRPERVNLGVAAFALTVAIFYFSSVMDKLGRSASLLVLGMLFLGGGWSIEQLRRRMVERTRSVVS
jgi:hypothetical protein